MNLKIFSCLARYLLSDTPWLASFTLNTLVTLLERNCLSVYYSFKYPRLFSILHAYNVVELSIERI